MTADDHRNKFPADYAVGYGKPPAAHRFSPGVSGNPKGRPKGSGNKAQGLNAQRLDAIIKQEAYRTIKVADGGRQITISLAQAIMRSLAVNAAKGQPRAQKHFMDILRTVEEADRQTHEALLQSAVEYKHKKEQELAYYARMGLRPPALYPHPDDIHIDMRDGTVSIKGPFTKEERPHWDMLRRKVLSCDEEIAACSKDLRCTKKPAVRKYLQDDIDHAAAIRQIVVKYVGEPNTWRQDQWPMPEDGG